MGEIFSRPKMKVLQSYHGGDLLSNQVAVRWHLTIVFLQKFFCAAANFCRKVNKTESFTFLEGFGGPNFSLSNIVFMGNNFSRPK